ncbi:MAG TPA: acyltransferase family protein [Caulobacteraceae bacterium]|nr:acyltransferase family protein [Caulobacteraceae bacterium]
MATVVADRPAGLAPTGAGREGFRSDINGLRAIAVALVMAFHLGRGHVGGGFSGVDVFFAISGYLMTRIVEGGVEAGRFRLRSFYFARVRRIVPALAAFCAALWLFGATLLDPWTFERLAANLPYALLFISNIMFANRGGYFAEDARTNWVLHTWSLSVEWQFYLLYPLLLLALWRWAPRRWLWPILAALAAGSFALALAALPHNATLSFYMLPTRAWELLLGALCVPLERRLALGGAARLGLHVLGLGLIAFGVAITGPDTAWPSAYTLIPVGGAALVIAAGARRTFWAENPAVAGLGRASYSIYLWHWPIVVWIYDNRIAVTWPVAAVALAGMIALGVLSYWLIEQRLTAWLFAPQTQRWRIGARAIVAVLALAVVAIPTHGLERLRTLTASPQVRAAMADDRRATHDWTFPQVCARHSEQGPLVTCQLGDPAARQVLLIGDSHAEALAARYAHAFDGRPGAGLTMVTISGCIPIPGVSGRGALACGALWRKAYDYAEAAGFRRVAVTAAWPLYFDPTDTSPLGLARIDDLSNAQPGTLSAVADAAYQRLADEVRRLQARGAQVVLIGATPRSSEGDPHALYAQAFWHGQLAAAPLSRAALEAGTAADRRRLAGVAQSTGALLADPLDGLCDGDACPLTLDGRALFRDHGHYRASMMTRPRFAFFDPWLAPQAGAASTAAPAPIRLK